MKCKNCGEEIENGVCIKCGTFYEIDKDLYKEIIGNVAADTNNKNSNDSANPQKPISNNATPNATPKQKKHTIFLIIAIIISVIMLAVIISKSIGDDKAEITTQSTTVPITTEDITEKTTIDPTTDYIPVTYIDGTAKFDKLELIIEKQKYKSASDSIEITLFNNDPDYYYEINNFFCEKDSIVYFNEKDWKSIEYDNFVIAPGNSETLLIDTDLDSIENIDFVKITNITKYQKYSYEIIKTKDITIDVNFTEE